MIVDNMGEIINSTNNSLDVAIQDQYTDLVDYFFCRDIRGLILSQPMVIDSYTVTVTDASLVTIGNYLCIQENKRAFQTKILNKVGNVLTIDTPIDYNFSVNAYISERTPLMNYNGSVTPGRYILKPIPGVKWDITRILFSMVISSAGSDVLFGNLPALTRGIVLRKSNGIHHTIFNAKTNGDFALRTYDVTYSDKAVPAQSYGIRGWRAFNGQDRNGIVIRLDGDLDEQLEILIQDDLSGLTSFRMVGQGHVVE